MYSPEISFTLNKHGVQNIRGTGSYKMLTQLERTKTEKSPHQYNIYIVYIYIESFKGKVVIQ